MTISGADDEWPTVEEYKQLLDVDSGDWDATLDLQLDAAIAQVKIDVGAWDELVDIPDASLGRAALRLAILLRVNADSSSTELLSSDPIYQRFLKGHHRRFPIA